MDISSQTSQQANSLKKPIPVKVMNYIVLIFSLALIVWISYDTLNQIVLLWDVKYMQFQFWVCLVFILDFFVGLGYSQNKWRYFRRNIFFLLLSIPYLNVINALGLDLNSTELYFIRFIPLARGALAMAIVVGYLSSNAVTSLFISYLVIMVTVAYFCSLILFEREYGVNPAVNSYGTALWWSCMNLTTVGCSINPVTPISKIVLVLLPVCGMIMFPMFTVYLTNYLTNFIGNNPKQSKQ